MDQDWKADSMDVDVVDLAPLTATLSILSASGGEALELAAAMEDTQKIIAGSAESTLSAALQPGAFTIPKPVPRIFKGNGIAKSGRQRSKSLVLHQVDTPGAALVKPLSSAFHSTGVLSRKVFILIFIAGPEFSGIHQDHSGNTNQT